MPTRCVPETLRVRTSVAATAAGVVVVVVVVRGRSSRAGRSNVEVSNNPSGQKRRLEGRRTADKLS